MGLNREADGAFTIELDQREFASLAGDIMQHAGNIPGVLLDFASLLKQANAADAAACSSAEA